MKNVFNLSFTGRLLFLLAAIVLVTACKKNNSTTPVSSGIAPDSAGANAVLALQGSGLNGLRSIVFDNGHVPASFNPNFNTSTAVIFRVPDTALGGKQNIVFTFASGATLKVPFNVIAVPLLSGASDYSYTAGQQITLTGNNLEAVNSVALSGTTARPTIVSTSHKSMIITMPSGTTASATKITVSNPYGSSTLAQEVVNADASLGFFKDSYLNGEQDAAWGNAGFMATDQHISGTASYGKVYAKGQWHQMGFGWNTISTTGYQYISFWMKGGSADMDVWLMTDKTTGGFGNFVSANRITLPAKVWTYFKLPLTTLDLGTGFQELGWRLQGPNSGDETLYLDDVFFQK